MHTSLLWSQEREGTIPKASLLTPQSLDQKFVVVSTGTILFCFGLHCFCQSAKESEPLLGPLILCLPGHSHSYI